ncbi:MAG: hypothetical protein JWN43_828 [Gammaproteobacteria bacterium]|nr:hypothetical protein [Gammaproteobacteria bacterium]
MHDSTGWGLPRYATLLVVVTLHLAVIAAFMRMSRTGSLPSASAQPIEVLLLPPVNLPKVRSENARPRRSSGDTAMRIALPVLESPTVSLSPRPVSSMDGNGSGVDWAAEARRALEAFEIRNHKPQGNRSVSSEPVDDNWWPHPRHRAGERFKTASGDWIVWIDANCYQVASAGPSIYAIGATLSRTICPGQSGADGQ